MDQLLSARWSPYLAGIGIGIISMLTFLISRRPIGCSTTFARTSGMIERLFRGSRVDEKTYYRKFHPVIEWEWMFVLGIVLGALISALIAKDFHLLTVPRVWEQAFGAAAWPRLGVALCGGVILGFGARWANGCTSGHGISGTLQLAVSSWVSVIFFFLAGILAAHSLYYVIPW